MSTAHFDNPRIYLNLNFKDIRSRENNGWAVATNTMNKFIYAIFYHILNICLIHKCRLEVYESDQWGIMHHVACPFCESSRFNYKSSHDN